MTLTRALSSLISSSFLHTRKISLFRAFPAVPSSHMYTTSSKKIPKKSTTATTPKLPPSSNPDPSSPSDVPASNSEPTRASLPPRPSIIPWQVKASNTVQLTGSISVPPKSVTSGDGVFTAVSVIVQENSRNPDLPELWIPIIFQGTLAESAASHLREKDVIYVTGHLTRAATPAPPIKDVPESGLQLIVSDFSVVLEKTIDPPLTSRKRASISVASEIQSGKPRDLLWKDLVTNPNQWIDRRPLEQNGSINPRSPDLKQRDNPFTSRKGASISVASGIQSGKPRDLLWKDLVTNPNQWIDCRPLKQNGSINPRSPDFKQRDNGPALWVDNAPPWAYEKLDDLSFDVLEGDHQNPKSTSISRKTATSNGAGPKMLKDDMLWKDLVTNPHQWVDYRMLKQNGSVSPRFPDFKNSESQQSLWLDKAPKPVLEKLGTLAFTLPAGGIGRAKMTSGSWKNASKLYRKLLLPLPRLQATRGSLGILGVRSL